MTLDSLVRQYLIEVGEQTLHKYARFLQYAIAGLRELSLDTSGVPKTVTLTPSANNTVDLPVDFISHIRIAVCSGDGNLHSLGWNSNMCLLRTYDECGDPKSNTGSGEGGIIDSEGGHFINDEQVGRYFGLGGGTNSHGYYRIDERNNWITLQNVSASTIWLEYLADIERNTDGEFEVHPYIVEAIKEWIHWKIIQRNVRSPVSQEQRAKHNFLMEKKKAKKRFGSFTFQEANQAIRRTFSLAPKT